jgi:septal ring factor EnvC (AmiA/AmiB activator)
MNTLIVILQQSCTGAILEILLLLVVAGLIGYLTAYFYYKSVYTKKINFLKGEISELKKHIETLFSEKAKLEETIKEKNAEIETLKKPKKN